MKHQYFGDINDYRKYGLLRALQAEGDLRLAVAWMTTPDDGSSDGNLRAYLRDADRWSHYDPELYAFLRDSLNTVAQPHFSLIETTDVLPRTTYFSPIVPDDITGRRSWATQLLDSTRTADLVFLDPDNGLEIPSKPIGRKNSSKYAAWTEVEALWTSGSSLLVYQHFTREQRDMFTSRIATSLRQRIGGAFVQAFRTPHVLFVLAAQQAHADSLIAATANVSLSWSGQLDVVEINSG